MSTKPRADAERNRARVLEAARALFAERGDDVQMPEIARAAGVGVGTVYRHFPDRQALVEAAAEHRFAEIEEYARAHCFGEGSGLERYFRHVGELLSGDRGLTAAIDSARGRPGSEPRGGARGRLESVVAEVIAHDQAAGLLRADCAVSDVYLLVGALSSVIRAGSDWGRFLDLLLPALRDQVSTQH
ncbi:TetR/AcrR family transcriptional regulator [Amycolatopsis umgeniensis]|uniref:AcrR family transcriptional regulator n=1 Tax=Amycolatopsis umgeniensis TaxID=336628 RepID=A0A841B3C5_9PSEU|nr:TetR/AcrR family transcriptional regulator [Amycolatopsis umgeniensis]MBB5853340.1 AcrR family transcriptional regulator [Amycolatopsis umgeniensis]